MQTRRFVAPAVAVALVLHQDAWNWANSRAFFGLFPAGLAYHLGYSIGAALLLAWIVRVAWPSRLEDDLTASSDGSGPSR